MKQRFMRRRRPPAPPTVAPVTAEPVPEDVSAAPAAAPSAPPAPATAQAHPGQPHRWEVAYDRGVLGDDGIWRFPHRCRDCSLEVLAQDFPDATARAGRSA